MLSMKMTSPQKTSFSCCTVENHVPGGMPGSMADFEVEVAQAEQLSVAQRNAWPWPWIDVQAEKRGAALCFPQRQIGRVQGHRRRRLYLLDNPCHTGNVIKVGVGQPDGSDAPATAFGLSGDILPVPGGVDDHSLVTGLSATRYEFVSTGPRIIVMISSIVTLLIVSQDATKTKSMRRPTKALRLTPHRRRPGRSAQGPLRPQEFGHSNLDALGSEHLAQSRPAVRRAKAQVQPDSAIGLSSPVGQKIPDKHDRPARDKTLAGLTYRGMRDPGKLQARFGQNRIRLAHLG